PVCVLLGMSLSSWSAAAAGMVDARSALSTIIRAILVMIFSREFIFPSAHRTLFAARQGPCAPRVTLAETAMRSLSERSTRVLRLPLLGAHHKPPQAASSMRWWCSTPRSTRWFTSVGFRIGAYNDRVRSQQLGSCYGPCHTSHITP